MAADLLRFSLSSPSDAHTHRKFIVRRPHFYSFSLSPRRNPRFILSKAVDVGPPAGVSPETKQPDASFVYDVTGMMCGACVSRVKGILSADERVESAVVNMLTETAAVKLKPEVYAADAAAEDLARRLTECGFESRRRVVGSGVRGRTRRWKEMAAKKEVLLEKSRNRVILAWTLVALCCGSHASHLLHSLGIHVAHGGIWDVLHNSYVKGTLALGALLGPGRDLLYDGLQAFVKRSPNMNSLVGFGSVAAFILSMVSVFIPGHEWDTSFFDEPVMLLGFVLLGRSLEERARIKASSDMNELLSLVSTQARLVIASSESDSFADAVLSSDTICIEVPTDNVRVGDSLLVLPGETIPVDVRQLSIRIRINAIAACIFPDENCIYTPEFSKFRQRIWEGEELFASIKPLMVFVTQGKVVAGRSVVDESMLTGESLPVFKEKGFSVSAGTINWEGPITVEATSTGSNSTICKIIHMVEEAQSNEAPIQRLADLIAGPFVYSVITLSLATFAFWSTIGVNVFPDVLLNDIAGPEGSPLILSLKLAVDVLVISCPCALGLATPTAILVGTSLGARQGLLLRGGDVLERLARVDIMAFDKTGTLTEGKPTVSAVASLAYDSSEILKLAAAVEKTASHPLAKAIMSKAESCGFHIPSAKGQLMEPGFGCLAEVDGRLVAVGSLEWVFERFEGKKNQVDLTCLAHALIQELSKENPSLNKSETMVYVGREGEGVIGAIAISDALRHDAKVTISRLKELGINAVLLSGDKQDAVGTIAKIVGVENEFVQASMTPQRKSQYILDVQSSGHRIAMVGDGINDAPSLTLADVGIALKTETQENAASEAASIVLLGNRLSQVVDSVGLARATMSKVQQNLLWAVAYNVITIPIAAGVLLPHFDFAMTPSLSGGLMALSSIFVVTNSILLQLRGSVKEESFNQK